MKLLEAIDLKIDFKTDEGIFSAVKGVHFSIEKGKTLGIVGESGSGKSVSSLSIMRLLAANSILTGAINFEGRNLITLSEKEMRNYRGSKIAMIFQEPMTSLNPVLKCGDQVAEALILHKKLSKKEAREKTIALFEKVKLPRATQLYDAYPHQLSGGQKQRVMIAMAISCEPQLLIADEPTTALDVTVQKTILELLSDLQRETGMAMIFITHDLGVIAEIADEVAVMYKGNVVESGSAHEIFSNPQHPYTKGLLACRPPLNIRPERLPVIKDFMEENTEGGFKEKNKSVSEALSANLIDDAARSKYLEKIYSQTPVLEVKNVTVKFAVSSGFFSKKEFVTAVNDVTFNVYKGETLGLVGESGCGKTTLGRTIIRLMEPTSGTVRFNGVDFLSLQKEELRKMRKKIQIIFQDPYASLNPRMTIGNAILEPMKVHKLHDSDRLRRGKVIELLEKVGLNGDHYSRYPHEFSGGQRQRVCIARALALEPEFIICDESVSALDVSVQAQVLNLLNDLKKDRNLTYIFISHDLAVVKYMSDRMLVMNKGVIEEEGDPDIIYSSPKSEYTARLISAIPAIRYLQK